jgi:hypothetical membrane protein
MVSENENCTAVQSLLAICGIVGPILKSIAVATLAFLWPGYSHISQFMSELGAIDAPNAIIMNVTLVVFGFLMICFAFGLHKGISQGEGSIVGPALVTIYGAGQVGNGIFPCAPGCADPWEIGSFTGIMHNVTSNVGYWAILLAQLVISRRLKNDKRWLSYGSFSVVTGLISIGAFLLFSFLLGGFLIQWAGAFQRLRHGIVLVWIIVMAVRLLRISVHA